MTDFAYAGSGRPEWFVQLSPDNLAVPPGSKTACVRRPSAIAPAAVAAGEFEKSIRQDKESNSPQKGVIMFPEQFRDKSPHT